MNKRDFLWLTHHSEIANLCPSPEACETLPLILRVNRPNHTEKVRNLFSEYKINTIAEPEGSFLLRFPHLTVNQFCAIAMHNGSDLVYNMANDTLSYEPVDRDKYMHIFRRSSPRMLANLPPHQKLNTLMNLWRDKFRSSWARQKYEDNLYKHVDKLLALLQLPLPPEFMRTERQKVHDIVEDIGRLPQIKSKLENFNRLPPAEQKQLLLDTCRITAAHNGIKMPKVIFTTGDKIAADAVRADWIDTDGCSNKNEIEFNTDKFHRLSSAQALSLAWHETTHIAQAYGDYSAYPQVEDMFCPKLDYLQLFPETYPYHPQETVTYALEKQFIEDVIARTRAKPDERTFSYAPEYDIAVHNIARALRRHR